MKKLNLANPCRTTLSTGQFLNCINNNKKNKKAFTLAEILITLTILGLIAAITIPNIINHIWKQELISRLKLSLSTLNHAIGVSQFDNGHVAYWNYNTVGKQATKEFAQTYLIPYLNVQSECDYGSEGSKCFKNNKFYTPYDQEFGYVSGQPISNAYMFTLKNGISYAISKYGGNNVRVWVDINGPNKGHSRTGEDIFVFQIDEKGVSPYEHWYANTGGRGRGECLTGNVESGAGGTGGGATSCALYIIANNWTIPKDYNPFNINKDGYDSWSGPSEVCGGCQKATSKSNSKEKTCCNGKKAKYNEETGHWEETN